MDGCYFFIKRLNKGVTESPDFPKVEGQVYPGGWCMIQREGEGVSEWWEGEYTLSLAPNFLRSPWTKTEHAAEF